MNPGGEDMQEKIYRINSFFQSINLQKKDLVQQNKVAQPLPTSNYNSRGQIMLSPKDIRQRYDKAIYGFKWYQIPLCRKSIRRKINFWAPASVVMAWTYGEYVKKKDPTNVLKSLPFKFYVRSFGVFFAVTSIYCFAQSILYDEFCDIESPYYQETETRLSIARKIKSQMNNTKDGGFMTSIFG